MSLSRRELQAIRWTSAALALALVSLSWFWKLEGGWGVLWFFGFLIVGAPGALITLHLMDKKASPESDNG